MPQRTTTPKIMHRAGVLRRNQTDRRKLIIELDGSQHLHQQEYDRQRTLALESPGYRVLRSWNHEVTNQIDRVLEVIWREINK